jgi:hypothetical protein
MGLMQINEHSSTVQSAVGGHFRSVLHIIMNFPRVNLILINVGFATAYFLIGELRVLSASFKEPSDAA